jgi:hypothetical protein
MNGGIRQVTRALILIGMTSGLICVLAASAGASSPMPDFHGIYVKAANDEGITFDPGHNGAYYIQKLATTGQGFNALHITTDPSAPYGQVTVSSSQFGVFYVTDTGGRGYEDNIVLMLAVNGTIPDNFKIHVRTSGYHWVPSGISQDAPPLGAVTYQPVALDETFDKNDFIYGPQTWKPTGGDANYPIFEGESMSDPASLFYIMFIDTHVGSLGTGYPKGNSAGMINRGAAKIEYTFTNLTTFAAFNVYAWNWNTNQGQGMHWTNRVSPSTGHTPNPNATNPGGGNNNNPGSGYSVLGVQASKTTPKPSVTPLPGASATPRVTATPLPESTETPGSTAVPTKKPWATTDPKPTVKSAASVNTTAGYAIERNNPPLCLSSLILPMLIVGIVYAGTKPRRAGKKER